MAKIIHGKNCHCLKTTAEQFDHQQKMKRELGSKGLDSFLPYKEDDFPVTQDEIMRAIELIKFNQNAYKADKVRFNKMAESDTQMQSMSRVLPVILRVEMILEDLGLHELHRDFNVLITGALHEIIADKRLSFLGAKKAKEQGKTKKANIPELSRDLDKILKSELAGEKMSFKSVLGRLCGVGYDVDSETEELRCDKGDIKLSTLQKMVSEKRKSLK